MILGISLAQYELVAQKSDGMNPDGRSKLFKLFKNHWKIISWGRSTLLTWLGETGVNWSERFWLAKAISWTLNNFNKRPTCLLVVVVKRYSCMRGSIMPEAWRPERWKQGIIRVLNLHQLLHRSLEKKPRKQENMMFRYSTTVTSRVSELELLERWKFTSTVQLHDLVYPSKYHPFPLSMFFSVIPPSHLIIQFLWISGPPNY